MMRALTTRRILGLLLMLAFLAIAAGQAQASHFRYGHITWEPRPDISPTTVDFRFVGAFRRSSASYSGSADDGRPTVGDVILERQAGGGTRMSFGDGGGTGTLEFKIIASNPEEDWILGVARERNSDHEDFIRKTYSAENDDGEPWVAGVTRSTCCRLGGLNTRGSRYSVLTRVDLTDGNRSPVSNLPPIVTCARDGVCSFSVPAIDPDGDDLRWRLSTSGESRITGFPGWRSTEPALEINPGTGLVTWETTADTRLGFYAAQFTIEDLDDQGEAKSSVAVDFLINIQDIADNNPPAFDVPPTPESGETFEIPAGSVFEVNIQASDPDVDDVLTLNHVGLPGGAEFESEAGNPAPGVFSWTPEEQQLGEHIVTFTAIDDRGLAGSQHPVRLKVVEPAIRDVSVTTEINDDRIALDPDSFATEPDLIEQAEGATRIIWTWPTLSPQAQENLDLAVAFQDPEAGERRVLTWFVKLEYTDINGNRVEQVLDPQYVDVLPSIFDVAAQTDRSRYGPDDVVDIGASLTNLGRFTTDGDVAVVVIDAKGVVVDDLGMRTLEDLEAGEERSFDDPVFSTTGIFAGDYKVRTQALDQAGEPVATATAPFIVDTGRAADERNLTGRVTTDRSVYDVGDIVTIHDRISNVALNANAEDLGVVTRLRDPDGEIVWEEEDGIAALGAGGERELVYSVPLGRAKPGGYRVELAVDDTEDTRAAEDLAHFEVRSTGDSGVGLAGSVDVDPDPVLRTERLALLARLANEGNAPLDALPAELLVVDGEQGDVLADWSFTPANLDQDDERLMSAEWDAIVPQSGPMYSAILRTTISGEPHALAQAWFTVAEKLDWMIRTAAQERILVMVDGPARADGNDTCRTASEVELSVAEPLALTPGDRVRAALYDQAGGEISTRETRVEDFESRWALRGEAGAALAFSRVDRGRIQLALMNLADIDTNAAWRLEVEVEGERGSSHWDSGYFIVDCDRVAADEYGDFERIVAWGEDDADPHGPKDAPTLAHQRRHLEALLRARGWSYELATSAEELADAVDSNQFSAYALLHEHEKLPEDLQQQLVTTVEDGSGLLVAGRHDQRNGRLDPALGIEFLGRVPHATGIEVDAHESFDGGAGRFVTATKPLRGRLAGAEVFGTFTGEHPGGDGPGNAPGGRGNDPHRGDDFAITYYVPDAGVSGYFGFDVLAEATLDDDDFFDEVLIAGLQTIATNRDGVGSIAREIAIENFGTGAEGRLLLPPTPGLTVVDAGVGRITEGGGLDLRFHVENESIVALPLWIAVNDDAPASVDAPLRIETDSGVMVDYADVTIPLQ